MIRLLKIAVLSISFLFSSSWLFGQASIQTTGGYPKHETYDQHTIQVRFNQPVTGSTPTSAWVVRINGTSVPVVGATLSGQEVSVVFDATSVNAGQNFLLPGQVLDFSFTNSGSLTTTTGGLPANNSAGFLTSQNNWTASCSDFQFKQQGTIPSKTPRICSPVVEDFTQYQYFVSLIVRNSQTWNGTSGIANEINWGDGATTTEFAYLSDAFGAASASYYDPVGVPDPISSVPSPAVIMTTRPVHNYPATLPGTGGDCSWNATITPVLGLGVAIYCPGIAVTTTFATYDTDNRNTGQLNLPPSVVNSNLVCRGTNVNMQFTDNTNLNCRLAIEGTVPNQRARAIRITYGSTNNGGVGNIPDVRVQLPATLGGATQQITNNDGTGTFSSANFFPTSVGSADANGVIALPAPVLLSTALTYMGRIFTVDPTNQVTTQRFYIKLEYWDVCNPYTGSVASLANAESIENFVEIITKPPTPIASNKEFCAGTTLNPATATCAASTAANQLISFELTAAGVTGSTAITWYFGNPTAGGVLLTNSYGTNCRFFRSGALASTGAQGAMRTAMAAGTPGVYSLWATYNITNGCTSDPVEVKLTVRPALTAPAIPTGIGNICNGGSAVYTLASAPLDRTIAAGTITNTGVVTFPTEYLWTGSAADVTFGTNPSIVDNITATFNIAVQPPTFTARGLGAALQYRTATNNATNNRCTTTPNNNISVNVYGITVGGTVSADQSICDGSAFTTPLTLAGQRGSVVRWERTGPGGLATIAHTGLTLTSAQEPFPPNGPGVYTYYAVVQNASGGPCSVVNSAAATITVNPIPPKPTITQGAGSAGLTICENGSDQVVLQSDNVGGIGATYKWFKGATLVQNSASNSLTLDTNAESGNYTVQLVGPAPTNCPGPFSDPVAVAINPLPTVSNATGGGAVCSGLPAPDIQFTFTGATNYDFTIEVASTPDVPDIVVTGHTSNIYTIVAPNPTVTTTYRIIALKDGNGCDATVLGGTRTVTIGGTAPTLDTPPSLSPVSACDDGASTTNPQLSFSLDPASASTNGFTLNYKIDLLPAIRSKTFNTDAAGDPTVPILFSDTELNNLTPSPHTVTIVSIVSPATCQRLINLDLNFTVNPRPSAPTGALNNTVCSDATVGVALSVDDPGFGAEIAWSTGTTFTAVTAGDGTVGGSRNSTFIPTAVSALTFYAFKLDLLTSCLSATGVAVKQLVDVKPTAAVAGADQPLLCGTTATMAATPADNGGVGTWTVVTPGYPGIAFGNTHSATTTVTALPQDVPNGSAISVTLRWTVASAGLVCATTDDDVILTINSVPKALVITPAVCADVPGGTTASNVTLSGYNDRVTDITGSTNRIVKYYTTSARTPAVEVTTPQTFATGKVFFTRVSDATTSCINDGTITFTVEQLPVATTGLSYQFCETSVGLGTATGINLVTLANAAVRGGAPATAANRLIEWFEDATFTTPIPSGSGVGEDQNYTIVGIGTKTIYARVTNLSSGATTPSGTASLCTNSTSVDLILNARPVNNLIQDPSGATPASITLCKTTAPLFFRVDATLNPGSTYTWSVPTGPGQFQLVAGGGTNSPNFFILVAFPNEISSPGLPITVQETVNGCLGNVQTINVIVDDSPDAPDINFPSNVCENQTGVPLFVLSPNPTSTYTWTLPPLAVISGGNASKSSISVDFNLYGGDVYVEESNTTGCTSDAGGPFHINIYPRPLVTSTNTTICSGTSPDGNGYALTSSIGGSTFNWQVVNITGTVIGTVLGSNASNSQLTESITNISGSTAFVTYRVTPIGPAPGSCSGPTTDIVVTINPQPIITSPATNTICSGGTVAPFTADVIGTTFTWSVINVTGTVSGTAIGNTGAGNINQTLINTSGANAIVRYRVVPKSPPPCIGAFQDIDVTVIPEPVMTSPVTDLVCSGNAPSLVFTSNVPSSTFSWTVIAKSASITGTTVGSAGSGNITQILSNTSGASGTVTFRVTPQGPTPTNCVGAFQDVVVTVDPQPVMTSAVADVTCSGIAPSLVFTSNLAGSSFSWTVTNITGTLGGTVLGNTGTGNINEVISNTSGTDGTVTYRVIPTGPLPTSCPGAFQDVILTVAPQPVMTSSASNTICGGGIPTLVFASNIPGSTFAWEVTGISGTVGGTAVGNTGAGNISQTLTNTSGLSASVTYEVTPTGPNPNTCIGAKQVITVNVIPQPNMTSPATSEICSGSTPGVSFLSDVPSSSFTWTVTGITGAVGGTSIGNTGSGNIGQTLTNTSGINGTVTYKVTPTSPAPDNCVGFPQTLVVTVVPQPVMTSTTTNTICSGIAPTLVFASNVTGSSFAWEVIAKSGVTGGATIGNTGVGNSINQLLTNTSGVNGTVTYRVTPTGPAPNSCIGAFQDVVITIIPEPVMTSATTTTICSKSAPGVVFTSNVSASSFAWSVTAITGTVSGTSVGSSGTGNISQVLINTSGLNATVTYAVTPTGPNPSNCTGAPQFLVVTVIPEPVMTSLSTNTICSGGTPTLNFVADVSGGTFAWTVTNVSASISGATVGNSGTGNINQTLLNFSGSDATVTYQVTPTGPGPNNCVGNPQMVIVTVVSQPAMTSSNLHTICSNTLPTLTFTASIIGSSFNWQVIAIGGSVGGTTIGNTGTGNLNQLLTNNSGVNGTVTYRVTPTGPTPTNCVGAFQDVIVTVVSEPVMTSAAMNKICSGSAPTLVFTSNIVGSTFAWVVQGTTGVVGGTAVGNTGNGNITQTLTNTSGATATVTYRVTPTGPGSTPLNCPGAFQDVVVTVVPQPVMTSLASNTICSGIAPTLIFTSNLTGSTFAWEVTSMSASVSGTSVGSIGVGNIGHTLTNTSGLAGTVTYKVVPSGPGPENCVGAQQIVTVTVISQPVMTSANTKTICSGNTPGLVFTSNIPPSTLFNWEVININGTIGGTLVGNTGSGDITQTLINISGTTGSVTYRVTPTGPTPTNCVGAFQDVVITVTPQPVMTSSATDNICSNNTPTVIFTSNVLGSTFSWTVTNITGAVSGTSVGNTGSGAITQTLVNVSNASGTVTYHVIPSGPAPLNCPGVAQDLVVTVNPEPTAPLVTTIESCSREVLNFDLQTLINNSPAPVSSKFRYTVSVEPGPASSEVAISGLDRTTASTALITDSFTHLAIASNADAVVVYTVTPYSTSDNCQGTQFKLRVIVHPQPRGSAATFALCTTPVTGSALNQNLATQIVNGIASKFTYQFVPDPSNPTVVPTTPPPYDRTLASTANITDNFLNNTGNVAVVTYVVTPFSTSKNCEGASFTYQVTINTNPVGTPTTITQVCSNTPISFDPQIQTAVTSTFTWTATYATGLVVKTPGTGNGVISETLLNRTSDNTVLNAVYHVTPKAGSCIGTTFDITVPIKPEPVVATNLNETQCSGLIYGKDLATVTGPSASVGAVNYDVTATVHPDLIGTATVGNGLSATAIKNDAFINRKSIPLTVVYHVVPHASVANGGCAGESQDIVFTVNPEPVLVIASPPPVCSTNSNVTEPINVVFGTDGTSVNASTYQVKAIQYSTTGIAGPFSATLPTGFTKNAGAALNSDGSFNLVKDDKYNNKRNGAVTVRYTIQGKSSGGCLSATLDFFIDINPEPILDPALTASPCSGDPIGAAFELKSLATAVPSSLFIIKSINVNGLTPALTNAPVGVQINKDGIDNDRYTNIISSSFVNVVYTITPISADGCRGEDQTVTIQVNPAPGLKAGLDKIVCNGSPSTIVLADNSPTSAPASQYRLVGVTVGGVPISPGATVTGLTANASNTATGTTGSTSLVSGDKYTNATFNRIVVRYEIAAIAATSCEAIGFVTLTVEPAISSNASIPLPNDNDICSGDAIAISFNTNSYNNGDLTNPVVTYSYSMSYVAPATTGITGNTIGNNLLKDPSGIDISDVLINSKDAAIQVKYNITPRASAASGGLGCAGTPQSILITVQPRPKISPIADKTVCKNDPINLKLVSTTTPSTGVIKFKLISVVPETAAITGFTPAGTFLTAGTTAAPNILADQLINSDVEQRYIDYTFEPVNVDATDAVICANGTPITVRVTVNPRPEVTPSATALEICSSESIEVQLPTDTDPGSTIVKWTALASSVDVVGESNGAGDILFQTLLNKGNVVQTVDYTITPSFNGCDGISKHLIVTVNPIPTVTLPNKITVCAGTTFNLNLAPLANTTTATTFKWEVTDINGIGTPGQFDNTSETATAITNQVFTNNTDASATLLYEITPIFNGAGGKCYGIPKIINVSVAPTITAAFISEDEGVCEGTPIFLTFELHGQSPFDFVYSATDATGTVNKNVTKSGNVKVDKVTPTITTTYKIVSAKDALGCSVNFSPQPEVTITVYKKVTAGWTASIPPFVGGSSIVTFTNTSTPVDGSIFDYEWTFGTDNYVIPLTNTGVGPFNADYRRPGDHYVSLRAVNRAAPVDLGCESSYTAKITIPVLPLIADFKFEPKAACFPQNIQVTENTATGVAMDWKVTDSNNSIVATSNANLPVFLITSPGKYKISLRSYDPLTNQEAFAPTAGKEFTIYDNPVASFDVRPTLVYVPDTELTTFNFSTGAPEYLWDFGDGSTSTEPEPKYTYKIEGIYDITLIAMNDHGDGAVCTDTLSRKITAKQGGVTKVPNAFTPSPNGPSGGVAGNNTFNDVFLPIVKGAEEFNMQIFDRWGNLIFESNNSNIGWDGYEKGGKLMPAGVYVYKLTVRLSDGQRSTQLGDITMIR